MALQWFDGGDYITTAVWFTASGATPWDAVTSPRMNLDNTHGRTGVNAYAAYGGMARKNLSGNFLRLIAGGAFYNVAIQQSFPFTLGNIIRFDDALQPNPQCGIQVNAAGQIYFWVENGVDNASLKANPSAYRMPGLQWHYVELDVTFGMAPSGSFSVYVDGQLILSSGGMTTINHNSPNNIWANQVCYGNDDDAFRLLVYFDDVYCLDTTGPFPWNSRLGDVEVSAFTAIASGAFTQFTPEGSATNWQNVNLIPSKAFTFWNQTAASGNRDSYTFGITAPAGSGPIIAVMPMALMETDAAGVKMVEITATQAGVDDFSPENSVGLGYVYINGGGWIMEQDVNGNNWTITNLSATEFGVEDVS